MPFPQPIDVRDYGAIGDGTTDDTVAIVTAIYQANLTKVPLFIPRIREANLSPFQRPFECKINFSTIVPPPPTNQPAVLVGSQLFLPFYGLSGGGKIIGIECIYQQQENLNIEEIHCENLSILTSKNISIGVINCNELLLSGFWNSNFEKVNCTQLKIDGNNHLFGSYWNKFDSIFCHNLVIDGDKGSVNQNTFINVTIKGDPDPFKDHEGGLHIIGIIPLNPPAYTEVSNNTFISIDSSSKGNEYNGKYYKILNESVNNQTNTILNWYADTYHSPVDGLYHNPNAKGNWHILGSTLDASGSQVQIGNRNHYLFSNSSRVNRTFPTPNEGIFTRNDGDYLAAGNSNFALGGEWDVLDANFMMPYCLSFDTEKMLIDSSITGANGCPSGINKQVTIETNPNAGYKGYQQIYISLNFPQNYPETVTICIWYKGDNVEYLHTQGNYIDPPPIPDPNNNALFTDPFAIFEDTSTNGWKLLRFSTKSVTEKIILGLNRETDELKTITINSIFASSQKATLLPTKKFTTVVKGGTKLGYPITRGETFFIPINTNENEFLRTGIVKIFITPAYNTGIYERAILGTITTPFVKFRDEVTVISNNPQVAITNDGYGWGLNLVPTSDGINLTTSAEMDDVYINYILELDMNT